MKPLLGPNCESLAAIVACLSPRPNTGFSCWSAPMVVRAPIYSIGQWEAICPRSQTFATTLLHIFTKSVQTLINCILCVLSGARSLTLRTHKLIHTPHFPKYIRSIAVNKKDEGLPCGSPSFISPPDRLFLHPAAPVLPPCE